jgi:hypothetical protein
MTPSAEQDPTLAQPAPADGATPPVAQPPDNGALLRKIELLTNDKAEQGRKNAELNDRLRELTSKLEQIEKQSNTKKITDLTNAGDYKGLVEQLQTDYKAAQDAVKAKDSEIQKLRDQISGMEKQSAEKAFFDKALEAVSSRQDVINPKQLLKLLQTEDRLRNKEGTPVALNGGVEQPLEQFLENLKQPQSGYEHFFRSGGAPGMGAYSSNGLPTSFGGDNPYLTGNLTAQLALETTDPTRAEVMRREADRQKAAKR